MDLDRRDESQPVRAIVQFRMLSQQIRRDSRRLLRPREVAPHRLFDREHVQGRRRNPLSVDRVVRGGGDAHGDLPRLVDPAESCERPGEGLGQEGLLSRRGLLPFRGRHHPIGQRVRCGIVEGLGPGHDAAEGLEDFLLAFGIGPHRGDPGERLVDLARGDQGAQEFTFVEPPRGAIVFHERPDRGERLGCPLAILDLHLVPDDRREELRAVTLLGPSGGELGGASQGRAGIIDEAGRDLGYRDLERGLPIPGLPGVLGGLAQGPGRPLAVPRLGLGAGDDVEHHRPGRGPGRDRGLGRLGEGGPSGRRPPGRVSRRPRRRPISDHREGRAPTRRRSANHPRR